MRISRSLPNIYKLFALLIFILVVISSLNVIVALKSNENAKSMVINIKKTNHISNTELKLISTNNNKEKINTNLNIKINDNIKKKSVATINAKTKSRIKSGCCSVILQVDFRSYIYAYRRDSTYAADLYLKKVKIHGMEGLKEYKKTNTYFFHSLILKNGWYIGVGGSDNPSINKYLEKLGVKMAYNDKITKNDLNKAMKRVKSLGLGHFVVKSPTGKVGLVIYNRGNSKLNIFKMKSGEYLSIPNSPSLFRKGTYAVKKSKPVDAAIYIAGIDRFGVNRRNIMVYNVKNIPKTSKNNRVVNKNTTQTKIDIWVTNDNGKYVGRNSNISDNVIFKGKKVSAKSIPKIANKKYIGNVLLS